MASAAGPRCGVEGRPWVRLDVESGSADRRGLDSMAEQLRVELTPRGIDLCTPADSSGAVIPPTAILTVSRAEAPGAVFEIDVADAVTRKQVQRRLDLSKMPADARALTLVLAADELLLASWAELLLVTTSPSPEPPPKAVTRYVETKLSAIPPRALLGAALAFERSSGGQSQWGVDAHGGVWANPWLAVGARIGLRSAARVHAPDGSVGAAAVVGGLFAGASTLSRSRRIGLDVVGRLDVMPITFFAEAVGNALAKPGSATAVVASAGLSPWLSVAPSVRIFIEGDVGFAVRAAVATDSGSEVTGISGVGLALSAGVSNLF